MHSVIRKVLVLIIFVAAHTAFGQSFNIVDTFDDNRYLWWIGESDGGSEKITNGKLVVDAPAGGWFVSINPYVEFEKDFKQEASFNHVNGVEDQAYGLVWGYNKPKDDKNYFMISANGYYYIANSSLESTTKVKGLNEWVKTSLIKPTGQVNVLRVEQAAKVLTFFINGEKVFSTPAFRWPGTSIGVGTYEKMKIEVDDFKFQQNLKINLPANLTKGFIKENLGPAVNSPEEDLVPIISADGKKLYFGRENYEGNIGGKDDGEDFYLSVFDGTKWGPAQNLGAPINTTEVNNIVSISTDNNKFIFVNATQFLSRTRTATGWSEPVQMGLTYSNEASHFEGFLSSDGKAILMATKNSNNLFYDKDVDERDLYVSVQDQNGKWSTPANLGPKINSRFEEYSPFLAADGRTLYFSSRGKPGYGDVDIFMSKRVGDGWSNWTEPVNLGPEINSAHFDAYYVLPASGDYAYMVGNEGGQGKSDIIRIKLAKELKPDPVVLVKGKTLDAKTQQPVAATIVIENLTSRLIVGNAVSDPKTGDYQIVLPYGVNYGFHAAAKDHLSVNENLELITVDKYIEVEKNLLLLPIVEGQTLALNNVFFVQAKTDLKPESYPELDRLTIIMKENATMEIELGGYTDNVGSPSALIALSNARAETVKKYMVGKGIVAKRITTKGYGSANPVVKNDTEEHRRMNRRVEFKIVKR